VRKGQDLQKLIIACRTTSALLSLIEAEGHDFDDIHATTCIYRLAKVYASAGQAIGSDELDRLVRRQLEVIQRIASDTTTATKDRRSGAKVA